MVREVVKKIVAKKFNKAESAELILLLGVAAGFTGFCLVPGLGVGYSFLFVAMVFIYVALKGA